MRNKGRKPLDLSAVLKRMIQPAFAKLGITGVGWHTFRHSVGSTLADMGEHQLTIRDYLRHSNLDLTNQYLQATSNIRQPLTPRGSSSMRSFRADRCKQNKSNDSVNSPRQIVGAGQQRSAENILCLRSRSAYWTQTDPDPREGVLGN